MNRETIKMCLISLSLILISGFSEFSPAWASEDSAVQFVRFLKNGEFAKAYSLFSGDLKSKFSLKEFEQEQKEAQGKYLEKFGTAKILKAEELYLNEIQSPKSAREQLQIRDVDLSKFFFWEWFRPAKRKRRIFQFIFEGNQKLLFGVDTLRTDQGTVVANYELLPRLQEMLSSQRPGLYIKRIANVA